MSLVDPSTRLHRRPGFLRMLRAGLWALAAVGAFVAGCAPALASDEIVGLVVTGGFAIALVSMIGAGFVDNARSPSKRDDGALGYLLRMFGTLAFFGGLGCLAAGAPYASTREADNVVSVLTITGAWLTVPGAILLALSFWATRRDARRLRLLRSVSASGARAEAKLTDVRYVGSVNHHPAYRVTLTFTDGDGRQRWITDSHYRELPSGGRHVVRYDPTAPGRRSTIVVEWSD